jgi:hypothetical protein
MSISEFVAARLTRSHRICQCDSWFTTQAIGVLYRSLPRCAIRSEPHLRRLGPNHFESDSIVVLPYTLLSVRVHGPCRAGLASTSDRFNAHVSGEHPDNIKSQVSRKDRHLQECYRSATSMHPKVPYRCSGSTHTLHTPKHRAYMVPCWIALCETERPFDTSSVPPCIALRLFLFTSETPVSHRPLSPADYSLTLHYLRSRRSSARHTDTDQTFVQAAP